MTVQPHPDLAATTRAASDIFSVQRVFGPAYERDGTLVVPVTKLVGSHGVAGAHADARAGIRRGDPDAHGPAEHRPGDAVPGAEPAAGAGTARPEASGPGGSWHRGAARAARGPQWPFGSGRPTGRSGAHADGGGYAGRVKPLGVYVLSADGVRWQPALDLNRVILGGQVVGAVAVLALSWALRRRR